MVHIGHMDAKAKLRALRRVFSAPVTAHGQPLFNFLQHAMRDRHFESLHN
jgi:hypothetical protein